MKVMIMSTVFLQGFFIACDIFMRVHYTMFDTCIELWLNVQVAISRFQYGQLSFVRKICQVLTCCCMNRNNELPSLVSG